MRAGEKTALGVLAASLTLLVPAAAGAQTLAGTPVTNIAAVRDAGATAPIASNAVTLLVAERLDCTLTLAAGQAANAAVGSTIAVVLTNSGNGHEAFAVGATGGADASVRVVLDDGDGRYDPARDRLLADGTTPVLAPGTSVTLFVTGDAAAPPAVTVTARAVTGSGTPGTSFAGQGDGGGDAVVGATGAAAQVTVALATEAPPTIVETQAVLASDGSTTSRIGSIVTYTIVASFVSASAAASIVNGIPDNTVYRPGTLTRDGAPLPDADYFAANRITVPLGAVAAGSVHRVTFKATIQ